MNCAVASSSPLQDDVWVEMERSSQSIREIHQVNEHGGSRTLFDLCRQIRALAAAHRGDKIGIMIAVAGRRRPGFLLFPQPGLVAAITVDHHVTARAVEHIAESIRIHLAFAAALFRDAGFVIADPMAHCKHHRAFFFAVVEPLASRLIVQFPVGPEREAQRGIRDIALAPECGNAQLPQFADLFLLTGLGVEGK